MKVQKLYRDDTEMSDDERELFLSDLRAVCSEYFGNAKQYAIDLTPAENGLSVCIIFEAERVRRFKKPR